MGIPQLESHFDDVSRAVTLKGCLCFLLSLSSTVCLSLLLSLFLHPLCEGIL